MARPEPGAAAVREALARAREAGRALAGRPPAEVLEALGEALERLRSPEAPPGARLRRELPGATGFSPEVVESGLELALQDWTSETLLELVRTELGAGLGAGGPRRARGFETTSVLLAGALPSPTIATLLAPLALRSGVVAKPSAHDPLSARVMAEALGSVDPELGAALQVVDVRRADADAMQALLEADCVVATGSDETVAEVARRVATPRRFVGYGHRLSVAVLGAHGDLQAEARALALDVAHWDQLGCLSPVAAYVPGNADRVPEAVHTALANAFAEQEKALPRGEVALSSASAWAAERDAAELRAAGDPGMALHAGAGSALVAETDAEWRGSPLHRFLRLHPVRDPAHLEAALAPVARHLAAVGVGGLGEGEATAVHEVALRLGASRVCPLGRMQAPPIGWSHEGRPVLLPLARLGDLEV